VPCPIVIGVPRPVASPFRGGAKGQSRKSKSYCNRVIGLLCYEIKYMKRKGEKDRTPSFIFFDAFRCVVITFSSRSHPHDVSSTKRRGNGGAASRRRIPRVSPESGVGGGSIAASQVGSVPAGCGGIRPFPVGAPPANESTALPTENVWRMHERCNYFGAAAAGRSCLLASDRPRWTKKNEGNRLGFYHIISIHFSPLVPSISLSLPF